PLRAAPVSVTPESAPSGPPPWLRTRPALSPFVGRMFGPFAFESPCIGVTDADGRVTLTNFPPGGARIDVRLPSATWVRRLMVPTDGREVAIEVPGGFLPLRVSNAATGNPVAGAAITWTSSGARVEAIASASGEALLGGVAAAPGTLTIRTTGYHPFEQKLPEPPGVLHEVVVVPTRNMNLQCRVITAAGEPLPDAVVELTPEDPIEGGYLTVTDEKGFARFVDPPQGALRLLARADGYVAAGMRIPADATREPVVTLSRGYRVIARVESPAIGPSLIRILTDGGASVDDLLDTESDRSIEAPGRVSLGPLPQGLYTIELRGGREQRRERVRVANRDVSVTFR
ncbi:MAG: MSCRAMM family protein, partial [Vicinamibacterales bacterium]